MKTSPLALVAVAATAVMGSACGASDFRAAVPQRSQLALNVPGADDDGQALRAGATSELYVTTRDLARGINGGVGWVFNLSEQILALPPTETDNESYAVWGPSQPRGLERNSFRFTVNTIDAATYSYKLEARNKDATDESDFVVVWEGTSVPGDDDHGHGDLTIHFGALRSIDDSECATGDIVVNYAADGAADAPRTLDVDFVGFANACNGEDLSNATYHYEETTDGAGLLDFVVIGDVHDAAEDKPLEETFLVRSRWLADGQGRADVRVADGEIPADLAAYIFGMTATTADIAECWDASFISVYTDTNPDELEPYLGYDNEGDVAACAFAEASFAE
ncbi:MAG TPA: hypothetical protein VGF99_16210 [Myxococcota bacterium]